MNHADGWMNGSMGGSMWIWTVIGTLVVVLLVVAINKLTKKWLSDMRAHDSRF